MRRNHTRSRWRTGYGSRLLLQHVLCVFQGGNELYYENAQQILPDGTADSEQ
uniref:Uncharacterized protein n=1 Tax=Heterorhabditis bacteriophora TaxID=37862 RepID=A0A1I7WJX9_HETBA